MKKDGKLCSFLFSYLLILVLDIGILHPYMGLMNIVKTIVCLFVFLVALCVTMETCTLSLPKLALHNSMKIKVEKLEKTMKITVKAKVAAGLETVWRAWTTPAEIVQWNAASDDWHTTRAAVDLRVGGAFSSRMEAKDGSMGFDFAGTYTRVEPHVLIESAFGDRSMLVEFLQEKDGVTVSETFDAETENPVEMQRQGWQAILDNFVRHVERQT
jgi:uncharacterized protein YndB with AHSA1/START domain